MPLSRIDTAPRPIRKVLNGTTAFRLGQLSMGEAKERTGLRPESPSVLWAVGQMATRDNSVNPLTQQEVSHRTGISLGAASKLALLLSSTGAAEEGAAFVEGLTRPVTTIVPSANFDELVVRHPEWQEAIAIAQADNATQN